MLFLAFLIGGISALLFLRALFFTVTGQNAAVEGVDAKAFGMAAYLVIFGGVMLLCVALTLLIFGKPRTAQGWNMGKSLVVPIVVIGVVPGSIYGGIIGVTEVAGMGAIAALRGEMSAHLLWEALKRTIKATGTII